MTKTNRRKINKKGFSKAEFMIMLAALAILLAIGSKLAMGSTNSYGSFKRTANNFANAVAKYKDTAAVQKDEYTLNEIIKNGYSEELSNPMDQDETCDKYESFVSIKDNRNKTITLVCGNYVVEAVQGKQYKIFEVTDWTETRFNGYDEVALLYNYKENGELVLPEYVSEKKLLALYEEKTGINVTEINQIKASGKEVVNIQVFREKKLVKEL